MKQPFFKPPKNLLRAFPTSSFVNIIFFIFHHLEYIHIINKVTPKEILAENFQK